MSIDSINGITVQQPQRKNNSFSTALLGGVAAAGAGYLIGSPVQSKDVLKKDTFELSPKAKDVTDTDKANVTKINQLMTESKPESLKVSAEEATSKKFNGKEVLTAEEYLGATPEKFEQAIKDSETKIPEFEKEVTAAETKAKEATDALNKADDAGKEAAKKVEAEAQGALKNAKEKLTSHKSKIDADKVELNFAKEAKDGIKKEAYIVKITEEMKTKLSSQIDNSLSELKGKLPKVNSLKKAGIYGAIGFAGVYLLSKMMGGSKEA